jgi:hypothetical protein
MRGSRTPAVRPTTNDIQKKARGLTRHRRMKIARTAHTTLVKVDQWSRGDAVPAELATALEAAAKNVGPKPAKK